ncbi:MAG: tetratricopeptide repeat protein [Bacteroidetes bacterium]|nr:tetratricopeptide repeat protein [Bacteroidota bacterium]
MLLKRFITLCSLALALPLAAPAQELSRFSPQQDASFRTNDQFDAALWSLARQSAQSALNGPLYLDAAWLDTRRNTEYEKAVSGLKTTSYGALDSAVALLQQLNPQVLRDRLSLAIARYYFLQGKLAAAIPYYQTSGIANLSNTEIADAKFELAYCYFNNHQFGPADTLLSIMKEVPGKYYSPGNYYYGLLAYTKGEYAAALKSFARIRDEKIYRPVVPYYMAEIYYFKGERDTALAEALSLLQPGVPSYYENELHLLAAQCLFEAGRFGDALPYFEYYYNHSEKLRKEDLYEMGYAYYRVDEWTNAIAKFKPLSIAKDSLGQAAMYLLGDCYLKTNDKTGARNAFGLCAEMPYNPGQREAALLLHAKLCYETGFPDEAMRSLRSLMQDYPGSDYLPAARLLQSQLYLETNNYKDAYQALARFPTNDAGYGSIFQRAAYGYGLQKLQSGQLDEADKLLSESLSQQSAPAYTAATHFWKAEIAYRQSRYDSAVYFDQTFLRAASSPLAQQVSSTATRAHAASTLGYALMQLKNYREAQKAFATAKQEGNNTTATNASLREADAYFMQKDFAHAAPIYTSLASGTGTDAEYARLQSAIIAGLRGDNTEKLKLLSNIMSVTPPSAYAAEARYEMGLTQITTGRYDEAVATLSLLTTDKKEPEFAPKALLKIGSLQQQLNKDEQALESFRKLIRDFPSAPERSDALAACKRIFVERNQPDAYITLLKEFNLPLASDQEMDTAFYNAAELQYASMNWAPAAAAFRRYLQQFPAGMKALKARYYLANSLYNSKSYAVARQAYDTLLQAGWNAFSEESARRAAELALADTAWSDANRYYGLLAEHAETDESRSNAFAGLMRTASRMHDEAAAVRNSDSLLTCAQVAPGLRDEATLIILRQRLLQGDSSRADTLLPSLVKSDNAAVAAEAGYRWAQALFAACKLKESEKEASANIKRSSGYEWWLVKTYLLLGDISIAKKDYFNARATFQSVVRNTKLPELRAYAEQRLQELKNLDHSKLSNE